MKKLLLCALLVGLSAGAASAQEVVPPAGPEAAPQTNAAIAHHDRKVARHARRHGHYRKAARAENAANAAAADANAPK
jgi:hypothetical protein